MDLIAMAAMLIQQSRDIETSVQFNTHTPYRSFTCKNYVVASGRGRDAEFLPPQTFQCQRDNGEEWLASEADIIAGLSDSSYQICVIAGGMSTQRERTGSICIGDL